MSGKKIRRLAKRKLSQNVGGRSIASASSDNQSVSSSGDKLKKGYVVSPDGSKKKKTFKRSVVKRLPSIRKKKGKNSENDSDSISLLSDTSRVTDSQNYLPPTLLPESPKLLNNMVIKNESKLTGEQNNLSESLVALSDGDDNSGDKNNNANPTCDEFCDGSTNFIITEKNMGGKEGLKNKGTLSDNHDDIDSGPVLYSELGEKITGKKLSVNITATASAMEVALLSPVSPAKEKLEENADRGNEADKNIVQMKSEEQRNLNLDNNSLSTSNRSVVVNGRKQPRQFVTNTTKRSVALPIVQRDVHIGVAGNAGKFFIIVVALLFTIALMDNYKDNHSRYVSSRSGNLLTLTQHSVPIVEVSDHYSSLSRKIKVLTDAERSLPSLPTERLLPSLPSPPLSLKSNGHLSENETVSIFPNNTFDLFDVMNMLPHKVSDNPRILLTLAVL